MRNKMIKAEVLRDLNQAVTPTPESENETQMHEGTGT